MTFEQWALTHFPEIDLSKDQTGIYRNKAARDYLAGWEGAKGKPESSMEWAPARGWHWMKRAYFIYPVFVKTMKDGMFCMPYRNADFSWSNAESEGWTYIGSIDAPPGA